MKVNPDKPLTILTDKTDPLGVVLSAIINVNTKKKENGGTADGYKEKIDKKQTENETLLTQFENALDESIDSHLSKKGAVHNETKETVGLGSKPNYAPGTVDEQLAGHGDVLCTPLGLKELVEAKLSIDPSKYIRSRIVPIASGIGTGVALQTPLNPSLGSKIDNRGISSGITGSTPFCFDTDNGIVIFPSSIDGCSFTQKDPVAGTKKYCVTPMGGSLINIYNKQMEQRKLRPSVLMGTGTQYQTDPLIKTSKSLFNNKSIYYYNGNGQRSIRTFNKNELPFDVLTEIKTEEYLTVLGNQKEYGELWKGIFESRENLIYNIFSEIVYDDIVGEGKNIYLTLGIQTYPIDIKGYEDVGIGGPLEIQATMSAPLINITHNLPANGILKSYDTGIFNDKRYCIKLSDLIQYDDSLTQTLWNRIDKDRFQLIGFDWKVKMMGSFVLRLPIGITSYDQKSYSHMYLDLSFNTDEDLVNKAVSFSPTFLTDVSVNKQKLTENLVPDQTGLFNVFESITKENPLHPKLMDGVFDLSGGHTKCYTFYDRQYICYYGHKVSSVKNWISNPIKENDEMTYLSQSNLPNDGFYGDHLRHIPVQIDTIDKTVSYIAYTRDWNQKYRWSLVTIPLESGGPKTSDTGVITGPWRNSVTWFEKTVDDLPSFVIVNDTTVDAISVWPGVFNTQNGFKSYETFNLAASNKTQPFSWDNSVTLDNKILNYFDTVCGGWKNTHIQCFNLDGTLYWVIQNLSTENSEKIDCYYGAISVKESYPDELLVKYLTLDNAGGVAIVNSTKVNTLSSLGIKSKDIVGYDSFTSTDVIITKVHPSINEYVVFLNLAPFNNFYFEFKITKNINTKEVTFGPNLDAVDPIFPYTPDTGFEVDYDTVTGYNSNIPHRFHINFQSPVVLNGYTWAIRKTPGNYGVYTTTSGSKVVNNGIPNGIEGVPIFPLGSILTVSGTNTTVKNPLNAKKGDFVDDELYAGYLGEMVDLYGVKNNPYEYMIEPHSGAAPAGFIYKDVFYHYDPNGWKNDLFPVIDGSRLNIYGYGSSIPVFTGKPGSGTPNNKFFLK